MGLVLDVVPNHMSVAGDNAWWADVLEHGPASPFAAYFDIAWYDSPRDSMRGRLLLPVLGDPYGQVLEAGQLRLDFEYGRFVVRYWDAVFPLDPRTYAQLLDPALARLRNSVASGADAPDATELRSVLTAIRHLPGRDEADPDRLAEGRAECGVIQRRLSELAGRSARAATVIREAVAQVSGTPGAPASFAALDALLEAQAYRLSFWRVASDEINYRRFFDVNELAALSMEREDVFRAVHRKWIGWVADGLADGLRIDHPDGLFDPKQYLDRLQSHYLLAVAERLLAEHPHAYEGAELPRDEKELLDALREEPTPGPSLQGGEQDLRSPDTSEESKEAIRAVTPLPSGRGAGGVGSADPSPRGEGLQTEDSSLTLRGKGAGGVGSSPAPLYVVVEKILGDNEALPANWVCDGTAGYEFLNAVNGLFVDPSGEPALTDVYQRFTGRSERFTDAAHDGKMQILSSSLASELWSLSHQLDRLARLDRRSRDFTLNGIRRALREVIACFPVYRSYVNGGVSASDKAAVGRAVHRARKRNPTLGKPLFDFIRNTVLLADPPDGPVSDEYRALQRRFAGKFQQVTAPVAAKGVEDTALYVYNRLGSLNEVGGEPSRFGWAPERLHASLANHGRTQPGGLCPLSTHDTKRSEDVRARLNVLSELPEEWGAAVARWADLNRRHKAEPADADPAPDANEEWLLYQTLVGAWDGLLTPEFVLRVQAYMKKALAEAKVHSSWINPDTDYEDEVAGFVQRILDPERSGAFLAGLAQFAERVAVYGRVNALAQTVIRCTAPGVPDTYQGTELWDLSLVDPDNRRPVDYETRAAFLAEVDAARQRPRGPCRLALELSKRLTDPRAKLLATAGVLRCRQAHPALFETGAYVPVAASGGRANHVFAFARVLGDHAAIVAVPRLVTKLVPDADRSPLGRKVWADTTVALPADIPHGKYHNALTGERLNLSDKPIEAAELFGVFPVAVYVRE